MKKIIGIALCALALMGCRSSPLSSDASIANTYLHPYGFVISKQEWADRGQNGKVISHLKSGSIQTIQYENGHRHGLSEWTYPYTHVVCHTREYDHGTLVRQTEHYPSGSPKRQVKWGSAQEREVSSWYEDASPQAHESWHGEQLMSAQYTDCTGLVEAEVKHGNGERVERQANTITAKESYANGLLAQRIEYFPNAKVSASIQYLNGHIHGNVQRYNSQGQVVATEEWINGQREGFVTEYLNGQVLAKIPFIKGLKQGQEQRFRDGELIEVIEWVGDKKHGAHQMIVNGRVVKTEYYYHDIPTSKIAFEKMVL